MSLPRPSYYTGVGVGGPTIEGKNQGDARISGATATGA